MSRTLTEIQDDIDHCQWLRTHLPNLGDVLKQDRDLKLLEQEREALTGGQS